MKNARFQNNSVSILFDCGTYHDVDLLTSFLDPLYDAEYKGVTHWHLA